MPRARKGTMSTTRLRKVECSGCGYVVRMSRQWIAVGLPACPNPECEYHGLTMSCADMADAVECGLISPDDMPRPEWTRLCHENGWEDAIIRTSRSQAPRRQRVAAIPF